MEYLCGALLPLEGTLLPLQVLVFYVLFSFARDTATVSNYCGPVSARPPHREPRALHCTNRVWVLYRSLVFTTRVVRRDLRRIVLKQRRFESLTICWCNYKGSTFYSGILRFWELVRPESNSRPPAWQAYAQLTEPPELLCFHKICRFFFKLFCLALFFQLVNYYRWIKLSPLKLGLCRLGVMWLLVYWFCTVKVPFFSWL